MMMNEVVPAGAGREVRITRSQVFLKPLTAAQQRIVDAARAGSGIIDGEADKVGWLTLRAIVDKGHADIIERDGGRPAGKILSIRVKE